MSGRLISSQISGSLKSKGDKVKLACTKSGFNLSNDSLNSFSALGEGIVYTWDLIKYGRLTSGSFARNNGFDEFELEGLSK